MPNFKIEKKNEISNKIFDILTDNYTVLEEVENPDAVLVRSANMHDYNAPDSLLAVARAGAGVNNIPIPSFTEKGIVVFNTPGANANAVKELVLIGMLLTGRKIQSGLEWTQTLKGKGDEVPKLVEAGKKQFRGPELSGKTLGVIGLGAIGVQVANAAQYGLGMTVIGYDPFMSVDAAWGLSRSVVHATSIDEIITRCDYITLHIPLNDNTKHIINAAKIGKMKDGVVVMNYSRGGLVDNAAVKEALASGKMRQYITDFPEEELLGVDGIIALPHLGASTPESEENCAVMAADELKDYLENGNIKNSVNLPDCILPRSGDFRIALIHKNVPNMVGQISGILADEGINIEHMINKSKGELAYTLLDMHPPANEACLAKLASIEGMLKVRVLG